MLTFYDQTDNDVYSMNEHFKTRLDEEHVLLTTRHGGWVILSNEEFESFRLFKFDGNKELLQKLEEVGILLTRNSIGKIVRDLRMEYRNISRYASFHVIAVTNKCNLNCVYCHPDACPQKDSMDEDTAKKIVEFIFEAKSNSNQIVIEGGEPLLKFDLIQFIYEESKKASRKNNSRLKFCFGTNLTLMNEDIARDISKMDVHPCTSIDGPRELHDKQRPYRSGKGSYDDVMYWLKVLREDFNKKIHPLAVITNHSLDFDPKDIIDTYIEMGENMVFFKPFRPNGRASTNIDELMMDPTRFFDFWKEGVEYCIDLCKRGTFIQERIASDIINNIMSPVRTCMCSRRPCGAGNDILSYDCDGTINGCDAARGVGFLDLGHVNFDNRKTIREKALPLATLSPDSIPVCSSCPFMSYCNTCLCSNFGFHNDVYPKIPRDFECKWKKMGFQFLFKKLMKTGDREVLFNWTQKTIRRRRIPMPCKSITPFY